MLHVAVRLRRERHVLRARREALAVLRLITDEDEEGDGGAREARLGGTAEAQEVDGEDPACGAQGRVRLDEDAEGARESCGMDFFEAVTS